MLRHAECQRYRQWKKQQDALLKGPKRKIKKIKKERKEITDCIEEEKKERPKTVLKIRYRKCTPKETQKSKQGSIFNLKPVSSIDLLFRRIQPSLEVRYELLAHRHADCFAEAIPQIDVTVLREAAPLKSRTKRKRSKIRKKNKVETTIFAEEKVKRTKEDEEVARAQEGMANEEESNEKEEEGEVEETIEEKENVREEDDERAIDEKDDKREVKRKKKDKFWCKKLKRKIDSESEDSECDSICSFDSDICLKGLALTVEDKKKIEKNRRHVQASSAT